MQGRSGVSFSKASSTKLLISAMIESLAEFVHLHCFSRPIIPNTKQRPFLLPEVKALLNEISAVGEQSPDFRNLVQLIRQLISCLLPFEEPVPLNMGTKYQTNFIKSCVKLASVGGTGMFKGRLRRLQVFR